MVIAAGGGRTPEPGPATRLRAEQTARLSETAAATGAFRGLIYFHAVRRDEAALRRLASAATHPHDRAVLHLLLEPDPRPAIPLLDGHPDAWAYYTAAKACLRCDGVNEALTVMEKSLERGVPDTAVVNLTARYLAQRGNQNAARSLAQVSLGLAPEQADIERLLHGPGEGPAVYHDVWPASAPLTFYLPVYNVERYIRHAIEGLLNQTHPLDALIIVNDGTQDDSVAIAREYPVTVLEHGQNMGLAAARNTALRHSQSTFLGALDTDAEADAWYAQHALMEFENGPGNLAGVGGRLIERHTDTPADRWRMLHLSQDPGPLRIQPPLFVYGSNGIFRRSALDAAGGYDPRFRTNAEDTDLCNRLTGAGCTLVHTPHASAAHLRRDTPASVLRTFWGWSYWTRRNKGLLDNTVSIFGHLHSLLAQMVELINDDGADGYPDVFYVDFLYFFHGALSVLRQAAQDGHLSPPAARAMQESVLAQVRLLDARHGGRLHERVAADTRDLMLDAAAGPGVNPHDGPMQELLRGIAQTWEAIGGSVYYAIAAG